MRIFVAYGYNDRDRWIGDLVTRTIEAFAAEVVTGEEMQGNVLSQGVIERIRASDALIAFLTRRALCLVEVAETVGRWCRGLSLRFQLQHLRQGPASGRS